MKTQKYHVTFSPTGATGVSKETFVRFPEGSGLYKVLIRAITKCYGRGCYWEGDAVWEDTCGRGQIFKSSRSQTGCIYANITEV